MKAWKTWIRGEEDLGSVVVFAETRGQAKNLGRIYFETDSFIDVAATREPALDNAFHGHYSLD